MKSWSDHLRLERQVKKLEGRSHPILQVGLESGMDVLRHGRQGISNNNIDDNNNNSYRFMRWVLFSPFTDEKTEARTGRTWPGRKAHA